ncbi:hypothetical protein RZN05_10410 [Sphingomonas sp. HF-S4]|uniref:SMODS and SLOG-associating 2TM effector domain-containing protein n=1 Tax=Sphingomonas agrestis TaxID=3080540 RepID=A0ABU3Y7J0_9SPHN|nr:hypothetical protein [Sphingomonas sp. HF-S4]MDV3457395.1 hypothetical protein [Sphingomonas sp. HF-S4]
MSDDPDGGPKGFSAFWNTLQKELQSPWDWAAACAGGAVGFVASAAVFHADLGASAGAGALTAVSARKAGAASLRSRTLRKRTESFLSILDREVQSGLGPEGAPVVQLLQNVQRDLELFQDKVITADEYDALFQQHIAGYRTMRS